MLGSRRWNLRNPGARGWWEAHDKDTLGLEFVALVSEILGEEAPASGDLP